MCGSFLMSIFQDHLGIVAGEGNIGEWLTTTLFHLSYDYISCNFVNAVNVIIKEQECEKIHVTATIFATIIIRQKARGLKEGVVCKIYISTTYLLCVCSDMKHTGFWLFAFHLSHNFIRIIFLLASFIKQMNTFNDHPFIFLTLRHMNFNSFSHNTLLVFQCVGWTTNHNIE
jgi:hypothetical protein